MSPLPVRSFRYGDGAPRRRLPLLAAGLAVAGLAGLAVPGTTSAASDVTVDVVASVEPLKMECKVRQSPEVSGVRCRWSTPTSGSAAGLRLWRVTVGSDEGRQVVFRTEDVTVSSYTDVPVRPGHRYVYAIQAVDEAGRTVGLSRPVRVAVPTPPDDRVEALRLSCAVGGPTSVGCKWTLPTQPGARTLTLWRSLDGGPRQRVVSSHHPFPTAYRDTVPEGTRRAAYAVIATDGDGEIVARSRAEFVAFRDTPVTDARPIDVPPVDEVPVDEVPVDEVSVDDVPVDAVPVDEPAADRVPTTTAVPTDTRPTDTRPTDTRPTDTRPTDTRPTDTRPTDTRPTDTRPGPTDERPDPTDIRPDRGADHPGGGG